MKVQKIHPSLWFDGQAEQAAKFYCTVFPRSKITSITRYSDAGPGKPGDVMVVDFVLDGSRVSGINGGPHFTFSPAISLSVSCKDQKEVDALWRKLLKGGKASQCGWLDDKFGVSWQIVPEVLPKLMNSKHPAKVAAMTRAMLGMVKLDVKQLQRAYDRG
ncbi:MAG: VOC family protein [Myxococcales bacterium]|nr:VOC family protein [Myxococcales bacterium]